MSDSSDGMNDRTFQVYYYLAIVDAGAFNTHSSMNCPAVLGTAVEGDTRFHESLANPDMTLDCGVTRCSVHCAKPASSVSRSRPEYPTRIEDTRSSMNVSSLLTLSCELSTLVVVAWGR